MKRKYKVTMIDENGSGEVANYNATDIISLFMIIAKETLNKESKWGLKKIIIEDLSND